MKRERLKKAERLSRRQVRPQQAEWAHGSYWLSEQGQERAVAAAVSYDVVQLCALMSAFREMDLGTLGTTPDGYARSTARTYEAGVVHWVTFAQANHVALLSPPADVLLLWLRDMEQRYSPSTVQTYLAGMRRLYDAFRRIGASEVKPLVKVKVKKDTRAAWERRLKYSENDVQRLIEVALEENNPALAFAVSLGADAGLRASEIVGVKYEDIDTRNGVVRVARAKREKSRQVALLERGMDVFQALPPAVKSAYIYPYTARWLRTELQALCLSAGVEYLGLHSLRHAHGTLLAQNGIPLPVLAAQMGHEAVASSAPYIKPGNALMVHQMMHAKGQKKDR